MIMSCDNCGLKFSSSSTSWCSIRQKKPEVTNSCNSWELDPSEAGNEPPPPKPEVGVVLPLAYFQDPSGTFAAMEASTLHRISDATCRQGRGVLLKDGRVAIILETARFVDADGVDDYIRQQALAKLTDEERRVLGLE